MELKDFKIGDTFWSATGMWHCTDVGSRVVVAIKDQEDKRNLSGPPYSVAERVFDEYDMEALYPTRESLLDNMPEGFTA